MKSYGATIQMKLAVLSHDTICFVRILVVLTSVSQWMKSYGVTIQKKLGWENFYTVLLVPKDFAN